MHRKTGKILLIVTAICLLVLLVVIFLTKADTDLQIGISSVVAPIGMTCVSSIAGRKSNKKAAKQKSEPHDDEIRDKEKLDTILQEIRRRTETEYYKIHLTGNPTDLYSSKLGGVPYWDFRHPYPTDASGNNLVLLVQINFAQENLDDERLPGTGILQFFIADNDDYGYDFDYGYNIGNFGDDRQENWRIVYHETVTEDLTEADILQYDIPTHKTAVSFPMKKDAEPAALQFEKATGYISTGDYRFEPLLQSIIREKTGEDVAGQHWYRLLNDAEFEYICNALDTWGHRMLGYPNFAQGDVRREGNSYDTLLLEIDSDQMIMWGDGGVANFFINADSLKNRDFSKVSYSWDCG